MNKEPVYNTDNDSLDRIYKNVKVDSLWFPSYGQYGYVTFDKLREWMDKAEKKAKKDGVEYVHFEPFIRENEWGNPESTYIDVKGYRLETKNEYRERLERLLAIAENGKQEYEMKKNFYEATKIYEHTHLGKKPVPSPFEEKKNKIQTALNNIK